MLRDSGAETYTAEKREALPVGQNNKASNTQAAFSRLTDGHASSITSAGLQLARKLHIFPSSSRVNPLALAEDKQKASPRSRLSDSTRRKQDKVEADVELTDEAAWSALPENVIEKIFQSLKANALRTESKRLLPPGEPQADPKLLLAHSLSAVSQTWRRVANFVFLSDWWTSGKISRPVHCFFLTPRVFPCLLRCFVVRSETPRGLHFTLHQGERSQREHSKFLMAADLSRFGMKLYFSKENGPACGQIDSNLLCTKYSFSVESRRQSHESLDSQFRSFQATSLAEAEYRTRLQGCMRPRRMRVSLPGTNVLQEKEHQQSESESCRQSQLESEKAGLIGCPGDSMHAIKCGGCSKFQQNGAKAKAAMTRRFSGVRLENKTPHWNENMKCWCLNFRGRVKFASVKNFQLVDVAEPDDIVMQFGKVAVDAYIMDFQPASISAAQAFAVALSAFNKGLCPY